MEGRRNEGIATHKFLGAYGNHFVAGLPAATRLTTLNIVNAHLRTDIFFAEVVVALRGFRNIHLEKVLLYGQDGWETLLGNWASVAGRPNLVIFDQCLYVKTGYSRILSLNYFPPVHVYQDTTYRVLFDGAEKLEFHASPDESGLHRQFSSFGPRSNTFICTMMDASLALRLEECS